MVKTADYAVRVYKITVSFQTTYFGKVFADEMLRFGVMLQHDTF